jgi:pyruvate/2-oxoglutarate dehydrogenase complex dihydrolipoamide acyltransferase (E2) component
MIVELVAVQRCGPYLPGQEFRSNSPESRALIALGRAVRKEEYHAVQTYMTRDMTAIRTVAPAVLISEAVRQFALESGVDIHSMQGSGKDGRILKRDIQAAIDNA